MNDLKFGNEARVALLRGAYKVYAAVSSTLGARGRNVVRQNFGKPKITNDGVSVARAIELQDPFERQGADLLKEAAEQTNRQAGDGTTTATILGFEFFKQGATLIEKGYNPALLRINVEKEIPRIKEHLKHMAVKVETDEELESVATISIENPEYGKIVAKAVKTAGKDGQTVIEEDYKTQGIKMEEVNGYKFDRGWENPYLVTDADKMEAVFDSEGEGKPVFILIAEKSWNLVGDLMPLFTQLKEKGIDKLVIIADEISGDLMQFITLNRIKLRFHACVVKTPFDKSSLEDIAALTGGTAITSQKGIVNVKMEHLGRAKRVIITKDSTSIIEGAGNPEKAIESLRGQIKEEEVDHLKEKLQLRLAKLTGKTVMLKYGANTEAEAKYLRDKLIDAVHATEAALEEGILPGGGMALFRVAHSLYKYQDDGFEQYMVAVLESPLRKIVENCGLDKVEDLIEHLHATKEAGFNALTLKIEENIVKAGIIDPMKVERCALENAASLGCMLLTTETIIAEIEKNEK